MSNWEYKRGYSIQRDFKEISDLEVYHPGRFGKQWVELLPAETSGKFKMEATDWNGAAKRLIDKLIFSVQNSGAPNECLMDDRIRHTIGRYEIQKWTIERKVFTAGDVEIPMMVDTLEWKKLDESGNPPLKTTWTWREIG